MTELRLLAYISMIARESQCILPKQQSQISMKIVETQRLLYAWIKSDEKRRKIYAVRNRGRERSFSGLSGDVTGHIGTFSLTATKSELLSISLTRKKKRGSPHMSSEYEKISNYESLYQAHKMARRGKQNKKEVILYEMRLTENLERLRYHLENHTYRIRGYRKFLIYDPKKREIQALHYGDRIVQHSLCDNLIWKTILFMIIVHVEKGRGRILHLTD